jgi:FkbM family methyltransferase
MATVKGLLRRLLSFRKRRKLPFGVNVLYDISFSFPHFRVETIFDVGANIGQSSELFLKGFPRAQIYAFEPVQQTCRQLEQNMGRHRQVRCFNVALGSYQGKGQMVLQGTPDMFFLADQSRQAGADSANKEEIAVVTLDTFCRDHGVRQINYLKIDTEGGDLHVLQGAEQMLAEQRIDLVQVEAGMNVRNTRHVPFELLNSYLQQKGYFIFGIYEQMYEWPTNEPHLRRTNLMFISQRMIDSYRTAHSKR